MVELVRDSDQMIARMRPVLAGGVFVFCTLPDPARAARLLARAVASVTEAEGLSLILPRDLARAEGFDTSLPMAQITLQVHSALDGVGLTAAVAEALAAAGIPCNIVAGFHHDHVFVPLAQADLALTCLKARARA